MGFFQQLAGDFVFLRGVIALAADDDAYREESDPHFPGCDRGTGARHTATRRRCCPTARHSRYRELVRALQPLFALGAGGKSAEGRHRLPADAEPAGISWRSGSASPASAASRRLLNTNLIGPSLAHCIDIVTPKHIIVAAELIGPFAGGAAAAQEQAEDLDSRRGGRRLSAHRSGCRAFPCPAHCLRIERPAAHHRGSRALYLHVRHDRHAESRQHQSLSRDARAATALPA